MEGPLVHTLPLRIYVNADGVSVRENARGNPGESSGQAFTAPFLSGRHLESQVSRSQMNEAIKNEPLVLLLGLHKTAFPVEPLEKNPVWTSVV